MYLLYKQQYKWHGLAMTDSAKHWIDWAAVGTAFGTVAGWLPELAALASLVWTVMRIIEMFKGKTINEMLK